MKAKMGRRSMSGLKTRWRNDRKKIAGVQSSLIWIQSVCFFWTLCIDYERIENFQLIKQLDEKHKMATFQLDIVRYK